MSRPADWTPLAAADPVPGDPVEVALTGARLTQVADQISADVTWLRSLCTAQFWDSDAGEAFQGQPGGRVGSRRPRETLGGALHDPVR